MIDLIVDAGKLERNKPSTVIDSREAEIKILRRGELISKSSKSLVSKSERETGKIGEFLIKKLLRKERDRALVLGLSGDLGCGKTVFSRAIGSYLGVKEKIVSPTFFIYNEYKLNKGKFIHMDLYRIEKEYELEELGFWELFEKENIVCMEWPEKMGKKYFEKLKKEVDYVAIEFSYKSENEREIGY